MRIRNWDHHVTEWARSQVGERFRWGTRDCAALVRAAASHMYGHDIFSLPRWRGKAQALRILGTCGGMTKVLEQVAHPIGRAFVTTGDVLQVPDACSLAVDGLFVVIGSRVLHTEPRERVKWLPLASLPDDTVCWRFHDVG